MARRPNNELGFSFANVQIFRDQELGHGSYGAVYKAKCDSLPCAAKLIYPVLFASNFPAQQPASPPGNEHRQPIRRFEAECHFLSHIKHPNIVQYLGVYQDPQTNVPVLLMELMDESLTHFLETPQNNVLYHLQVNILHDTALALAFLHSNGITHRDMSSNNVLLIAGSRAKVTDFGMSTLTDAAASRLASMTQCPGTPAYMSPEALDEPPVYSEKLDCFSFGVLTIQAITREFPKPTDRLQTMELAHPTQPSRRYRALVHIPEEERRQSHISLIPEAHPLRSIALSCIKDKDTERPTAEQLCQTLEELKSTQLYASSVQQVRDKEDHIRTQRQTIEEKDEQIQDNYQQIQDKDQQIVHQQKQLQSYQHENQQLQLMLELKTDQITELKQGTAQHGKIQPRTHPQDIQPQLQQLALSDERTVHKNPALKELTLKWRKGPNAPHEMNRGSSTIIEDTVYIYSIYPYGVNGFTETVSLYIKRVHSFKYSTSTWSTLPECLDYNFTLTTINNTLTTVGGMYTNKLFSYCDQKWVELYPAMLNDIARSLPTVLSTTTHVAVMGGDEYGRYLDCVEVMNIAASQWSTAAKLPFCTCRASVSLCGDTLYFMGGKTAGYSNNYSVLSCQFSELLQSARPSTQTQPLSTITTRSKVWHYLPDLPVYFSTCVTVHGKVLAIGGRDKQGKKTASTYELNTDTNEWSYKSDMNIERSSCLATTLPDNKILVVGGVTDYLYNIITDVTEIATWYSNYQ